MKIRLETLIADLTQKLRRGMIDPHGPNLEDDLRGTIVDNEVVENSPQRVSKNIKAEQGDLWIYANA